MPALAAYYPPDWKAISRAIRDRSGGRCECAGECGLHQHRHEETCGLVLYGPPAICGCPLGGRRCVEVNGQVARWAKGKIVLTVAHLNGPGGPCRCQPLCGDPAHLKAMCQRCHLRYDLPLHRRNASATRYASRNNLDLFGAAS